MPKFVLGKNHKNRHFRCPRSWTSTGSPTGTGTGTTMAWGKFRGSGPGPKLVVRRCWVFFVSKKLVLFSHLDGAGYWALLAQLRKNHKDFNGGSRNHHLMIFDCLPTLKNMVLATPNLCRYIYIYLHVCIYIYINTYTHILSIYTSPLCFPNFQTDHPLGVYWLHLSSEFQPLRTPNHGRYIGHIGHIVSSHHLHLLVRNSWCFPQNFSRNSEQFFCETKTREAENSVNFCWVFFHLETQWCCRFWEWQLFKTEQKLWHCKGLPKLPRSCWKRNKKKQISTSSPPANWTDKTKESQVESPSLNEVLLSSHTYQFGQSVKSISHFPMENYRSMNAGWDLLFVNSWRF